MNDISNQECLRLYLIRHGEVEGMAEGQLIGRTDSPLSERGVSQAHQLAELLSGARLAAVYSSDLQRANMTAEIIARSRRLKIRVDPAWREIDMGDWEGRTVSALHSEAPQLVERLFADPDSFKYPEGESFADFTARVGSAFDQLLTSHSGEEIALIAHGGVCRTIIGTALGMPMKNWLRLAQDYGCLNVIDWYGHYPTLRFLNRIS